MTKVLIVDDLNSIREFLKINLSSETDIEVVGLANDGRGAITQVEEHQPDIVLMDINMPGEIDGIEATEKITRRFPQSKILLLTSEDDRHQLDRALRAGSRGYILKNTSIKDIANIIRLAEKGFFQIGPIVGDWNGSLHHSVQMSASKLERDEGDLERTDAIIPHKFDYAADASRSPEMSHTISNLSSQLFRLQETIESQEDTILNLANKYSQVQEDVARQLRRDRAVDRNSGFTVYGVKPRQKTARRQQNLLLVSSFLLGVITVLVLVLLGVGR